MSQGKFHDTLHLTSNKVYRRPYIYLHCILSSCVVAHNRNKHEARSQQLSLLFSFYFIYFCANFAFKNKCTLQAHVALTKSHKHRLIGLAGNSRPRSPSHCSTSIRVNIFAIWPRSVWLFFLISFSELARERQQEDFVSMVYEVHYIILIA